MSPVKVSFLVFSYNQEKYVEDAVRGALEQDYENIEFIFSDDCSRDNTFAVIERTVSDYQGRNIRVLKNDVNLGLIPHVNKILSQCSGDLIFMAAGDDISFPTRVSEVVACWEDGGRIAGGVFTGLSLIDEDGVVFNQMRAIPVGSDLVNEFHRNFPNVFGCSLAISKQVVSVFGKIPDGALVEDRILASRAVLLGGILTIDIPLVKYRIHSGSVSSNSVLAGKRDSFIGLLKFSRRQIDIDLSNIDSYMSDISSVDQFESIEQVRQILISKKSKLLVEKLLFSASLSDRFKGLVRIFEFPELRLRRKLKHLLFVFHPIFWLLVHRKYGLR